MKHMNDAPSLINGQPLFEEVREMVEFLQTSFDAGSAVHEVEAGLWKRILNLGRCALGAWLALFGDGDAGDQIVVEGRTLRRLAALHRREYQSVFGLFTLERAVYGAREGQKIERVPLDARLQLPRGKSSYLLQDWEQDLAVEVPYATVSTTLGRILGFTRSVHTLERDQREMATAVSAFWELQATPPVEQEGALLVITADGKGVPMRREAAVEPAPPSGSGMRPGTKKMALIAAAYTVDPLPRTPEEVLGALFHEASPGEPPPPRPKPCFKYVRAALERDAADSTAPQTQEIFAWLARQVAVRNPLWTKPLILLMDGQPSLWKAGTEHLPQGPGQAVEILDLLHALGYLWDAAHLFHPKASGEAARFVKIQALRMLRGETGPVIRSLRWLGTHHQIPRKEHEALERICGYFENNAHRMAYDEYLKRGFPIASGIIEGACRCVVKDRMERSGMRWVMSGAAAMLKMRCIDLSGLWEGFTTFRIQRESQRLYPGYAANDPVFSV